MKKILYVLNADWYFELHWKDRAMYAIESGHQVYVALPSCSEAIRFSLEKQGLIVKTFSMSRSSLGVFGELKTLVSLWKVFKQVKPDLVHSVTMKPNLYSTMLCNWQKIPLVTTYAGLGTLLVSQRKLYKLVRFLVFNAVKIFSNKLNVRALFENNEDLEFFGKNRILPSNRMVRVYGAGVDLNKYAYSYPVPHEGLKVFFASRLLKNKGLDLTLKACELLSNRQIPIKLKVAGIIDSESPYSYSSKELEDIFSSETVEWLGKRDDIAKLIAQADVVVLPTTYGEGIPRILIEACAIGRPIVTTNLGGCKDICEDKVNGYLVSVDDVNGISEALENLYNNSEHIINMGKKGRNLVESRFSNQFILSQNNSIYIELLG